MAAGSVRPHGLEELGERLAASPAAAWSWVERMHATRVSQAAPRRAGRVPTPGPIAARMARALLARAPRGRVLRVLDAGCGDGRLLTAVVREAVRRRLQVACEGIEIDPTAARWAQALEPLLRAGAGRALTDWTVHRADFLGATPVRGGFDFAIANPPYVPWRELDTATRARLADRPGTKGQDLAALFVSGLVDVLAPGGRLCVIVPNKLLAARYAASMRARLFRDTTLEEIWDLSRARVFPAHASYPVVLVLRRRRPAARHRVRVREEDGALRREIVQSTLADLPDAVVPLTLAEELLPIAARLLAGPSLAAAVHVQCGIAVSGFGRAVGRGAERILQSGDVRAYRLRPARPFSAAAAGVGAATIARLSGPKVLVPGMFRRLCAAYDGAGRLVGRVYFVAVDGENVAARDRRRALLLALFNSRLYGLLYAGLFAAVAQSGGWLRLNAPYLERLPWPQHEPGPELGRLVAACESQRPTARQQDALDRVVEALFGLSPRESLELGRLARALPSAW